MCQLLGRLKHDKEMPFAAEELCQVRHTKEQRPAAPGDNVPSQSRAPISANQKGSVEIVLGETERHYTMPGHSQMRKNSPLEKKRAFEAPRITGSIHFSPRGRHADPAGTLDGTPSLSSGLTLAQLTLTDTNISI